MDDQAPDRDANPSSASANEEALFVAALDLSPAERAGYLDCACGGDARLRRRVEQLLESHAQAGDLLETTYPPRVGTVRKTRPTPDLPSKD